MLLLLLYGATTAAVEASPLIPADYGEVIYTTEGASSKRIYIIGQSHRSALSGGNGAATVQSQLEIYRIGEWLIRERQVELMLPEGFFDGGRASTGGGEFAPCRVIDNRRLREQLTDTGAFRNAALLLNDNFGLQFRQVEDEALYREVAATLRRLVGGERGALERLQHVQERRSAVMLQNIPSLVESEYACGNISGKSAIFTIGMAHIAEIIRFLEQGRITLSAPDPDTGEVVEPRALGLVERGYGVTVILPRSLAEDREVLRIARLAAHIPE